MWTLSCVGSSSRRRSISVGLGLVALLPIAGGCPGPAALAGDDPLQIIELRSRLPEELIPLLAPIAGPDGTLVAAGNALLVRASPARIMDIRRALAELDRPARSLLIQVRQGSSRESSGAAIGARVDASRGSGEVIASAGRGQTQRDLGQEVRALDGHPAFIAIGRDQPILYQELESGPGGARLRQGQSYRRAESGFTVTPRVLGEQVTLDIETRSASPSARGAFETQAAGGRVQGRLGEWITIGGNRDVSEVRSAGSLFEAQGRREARGEVQLRVVPLD